LPVGGVASGEVRSGRSRRWRSDSSWLRVWNRPPGADGGLLVRDRCREHGCRPSNHVGCDHCRPSLCNRARYPYRLYQSLGFEVDSFGTTYEKPLA
ncbi:MAG: hypothetical protein MUP76_07815, partial [Acidimicrobiia bacterium]|nr:hypothetical protein [Acidimicrobiia bacterium]